MSGNILVLGGNGFIGQHVINESLKRNMNVVNISLNSNAIFNSSQITNQFFDITDSTSPNWMNIKAINFDYVVNCVGYGQHSLFLEGGDNVLKVHFEGIINLINNLKRSSLKGFVQLCTSDAYGGHISPQIESYREMPISSYSAAKTMSAHFLQMLYREEEFPVKILRLFLPYGPLQRSNMLIPFVIENCLNDNSFKVSKGDQIRDFLYIDDLIRSIFIALDEPKANGEIINIASGNPIKVKDVILTIMNMIGKGKPLWGTYPYRKNENMSLYASINKAQQILGWNPVVNLNMGLQKTIDFIYNFKR